MKIDRRAVESHPAILIESVSIVVRALMRKADIELVIGVVIPLGEGCGRANQRDQKQEKESRHRGASLFACAGTGIYGYINTTNRKEFPNLSHHCPFLKS